MRGPSGPSRGPAVRSVNKNDIRKKSWGLLSLFRGKNAFLNYNYIDFGLYIALIVQMINVQRRV